MYCERNPWLIGFHVLPPSSVRNAPAAEIAMYMRSAWLWSRIIVCRHNPPAPGCYEDPVPCLSSQRIYSQVCAPSVERNNAASSTPAYTVSGSVSDGSRCHTRLNSHGCGLPSCHWCVPGTPSYSNLLPTGFHVAPPSSERCTACPNQPELCEA